MDAFLLVALKSPPTTGHIDYREPHLVIGTFGSMKDLVRYVELGKVPAEWPYWSAVKMDVKFYVLASNEVSQEDLTRIAHSLRNPLWLRLKILGGPYDDVSVVEAEAVRYRGSWRAVMAASLSDEDASKLERVREIVQ